MACLTVEKAPMPAKGDLWGIHAGIALVRQASKQAGRQAGRQASKQASKQAKEQASNWTSLTSQVAELCGQNISVKLMQLPLFEALILLCT